jgi:cytochrome c oxidase subunit 4
MDAKEKAHIVGYPVLFAVWAALLGLTWLTVGISGTGMGSFVILAPFLIASVKAFLVVDYFMHLKYETALFKYILLVVLGMVAVVVFLVYQDVAYRP